jgi:replicative DNA helicase
VQPPFDLKNVAATADAFESNLILFDYIQRIPPPGDHGDRRGSVDATMNYLRQFADTGVAVIVVAAVARTKDRRGRSSYTGDGLNLASFRESSELEFGADDAFILVPAVDNAETITLRHLKARHVETRDLDLIFDGARQRYTPADAGDEAPKPNAGKIQSALAALWSPTPAPTDTDQEESDE